VFQGAHFELDVERIFIDVEEEKHYFQEKKMWEAPEDSI
jgi:hypothetical protein